MLVEIDRLRVNLKCWMRLASGLSETAIPKLRAQQRQYMGFRLNSLTAFEIPEASRARWKETGKYMMGWSEANIDRSPPRLWRETRLEYRGTGSRPLA